MKKILIVFLLLASITALWSCNEYQVKKPKKLVPRNQMINMLVDIHLSEAMVNILMRDTLTIKSSDMYHSVLDKYRVPDSVFIQSVIYYSSLPRDYERMYNQVLNILQEREAKLKERSAVDVGESGLVPEEIR